MWDRRCAAGQLCRNESLPFHFHYSERRLRAFTTSRSRAHIFQVLTFTRQLRVTPAASQAIGLTRRHAQEGLPCVPDKTRCQSLGRGVSLAHPISAIANSYHRDPEPFQEEDTRPETVRF